MAIFKDDQMLAVILVSLDPKMAKACHRKVQYFDKDTRNENAEEIVFKGNVAKFNQNPDLKEHLLATKRKILVKAAPRDQMWASDSELKTKKPSVHYNGEGGINWGLC